MKEQLEKFKHNELFWLLRKMVGEINDLKDEIESLKTKPAVKNQLSLKKAKAK